MLSAGASSARCAIIARAVTKLPHASGNSDARTRISSLSGGRFGAKLSKIASVDVTAT
jgi:hypothetical protein